jgi:hypothetical protein
MRYVYGGMSLLLLVVAVIAIAGAAFGTGDYKAIAGIGGIVALIASYVFRLYAKRLEDEGY